MSEKKFYKDQSKLNWWTSGQITFQELQIGCLMRIADATEKMATNYVRMENDLNRQKEINEINNRVIARLVRSNNALRGHLKKYKKAKK